MMDEVKPVMLIETSNQRRGNGKETPIRIVHQWWAADGSGLVFEKDDWAQKEREGAFRDLRDCLKIAYEELVEKSNRVGGIEQKGIFEEAIDRAEKIMSGERFL